MNKKTKMKEEDVEDHGITGQRTASITNSRQISKQNIAALKLWLSAGVQSLGGRTADLLERGGGVCR